MIYFDNASTTKIDESVLSVVNNYNQNFFYNPSSLYGKGVEMSMEINKFKSTALSLLGADPFDSIVFLSGATEANNFAIRGALKKNGKLLVSNGEHPSVYNLAKQLKNEGFNVDYIKLLPNGQVDEQDLKQKLPGTTVVSIIHVSNETGAINNIARLSKIIKSYDNSIVFHSDGVQAVGKVDVNLTEIDCDLYTVSGHKIHGPKGIGALHIKKGVTLKPLLYGGQQENYLRAGTENLSGIAGLVTALDIAVKSRKEWAVVTREIKLLLSQKLKQLNKVWVLENEHSSSHVLVFGVEGIKSEILLHLLEEQNVLIGNGSACSSRYTDNRVLKDMGLTEQKIKTSVRLSFSKHNKLSEVDEFVIILNGIIETYFAKLLKR